ncbi:MAG: hypothetical protein QM711_04070 [Micropruina sp.]|uniref:hypothetical protein n=1 Tax=Micropruina sp. TaxID=2737536 RepID=UPI0039E5E86E
MTGTVADLLHRLQRQSDSYAQSCHGPDPAWHELARAWAPVADAALRCFGHLRTPASEVELKPLSHDRARRGGGLPLPPPLSRHRQLSEVAETLGVLADLLGTAPRPDLPVVDRAGQAVADDIKSVLARLANLSLRTRAPDAPGTARLARDLARIAQFATHDAVARGDSYLHHWKPPCVGEPTVDGVASAWRLSATRTISSDTAVTSLAIQTVAIDIALISTAAARIESALNPTAAPPSRVAAQLWVQAADWPQSLRLGGRSSELRMISRQLRSTLASILQPEQLASTPAHLTHEPAQRLGLVGRLLNHAYAAAQAHTERCAALVKGQPSLWIERRDIPSGYLSLNDQLTGLHWLPTPASIPTVAPMASLSTQATHAVVEARNQSWHLHEQLQHVSPESRPAPTWETTRAFSRDSLSLAEPATLSGHRPTPHFAP